MRRIRPRSLPAIVAATIAAFAAACSAGRIAAHPPVRVGFIFVGAHDDLGYNRAAWEGSLAVARAFPDVEVLRKENVPETPAAIGALEGFVEQGATILFATSFGHLDAAMTVARRHPGVVVFHQGGVLPPSRPPNLGSYWGTMYEPMYLAGIAAGGSSTNHHLGLVAAFPIPATIANLNAFEIGARRADPATSTTVVFTGAWCDPAAQTTAANALLDGGADVLAQHLDCTGPVLAAAEARGAGSIGYHFDASEAAPKGWLVGAVWRWGPVMIDMVRTVVSMRFTGSPYDGNYRGGLRPGDNPLALTDIGAKVPVATAVLVRAEAARLRAGGSVFRGPLRDRDGVPRAAAGAALTIADADAMQWIVEGVDGVIPPR